MWEARERAGKERKREVARQVRTVYLRREGSSANEVKATAPTHFASVADKQRPIAA